MEAAVGRTKRGPTRKVIGRGMLRAETEASPGRVGEHRAEEAIERERGRAEEDSSQGVEAEVEVLRATFVLTFKEREVADLEVLVVSFTARQVRTALAVEIPVDPGQALNPKTTFALTFSTGVADLEAAVSSCTAPLAIAVVPTAATLHPIVQVKRQGISTTAAASSNSSRIHNIIIL